MKSFFENMQNKTVFTFETVCFATLLFFSPSDNPLRAQEQSLPAIHISASAHSQTAPASTSPSLTTPVQTHSVSGVQTVDPASQANTATAAQSASAPSTPVSEQTVYEIPIETASFNGITPGKTSLAELHKSFGKPSGVQKDGAGKGIDVEEYQIEGFKKVAFHVINQTVYGVIAELAQTANARKLADDLGMAHIQSVFMVDENGTIKGEIFPEIGVALAYDPSQTLGNVNQLEQGSENIPMNVLQIIFQTVSADPFLLRAETWVDEDPQRAYGDIRQALKLEPQNQKALAYLKVLEEAVPELKNGGAPVSANAGKPQSESSNQNQKPAADSQVAAKTASDNTSRVSSTSPKNQSKENSPIANSSQSANQSQTASPKNSSLTQLNPPELDSLESDEGLTLKINQEEEPLPNIPQNTQSATQIPHADSGQNVDSDQNANSNSNANSSQTADLTLSAPPLPDDAQGSTANAPGSTLPTIPNAALDATLENPSLPDSLENAETQTERPLPEDPVSTELPEGSLRVDATQPQSALDMPNELVDEFDSLNSDSANTTPEIDSTLSFEDELFEKVEFLAKNQNQEQALELLLEIRKKFLDNPFVAFRANLVEGDILSLNKKNNLEQAFFCHRRAAEQGEKLLEAGKVVRGKMVPLTNAERVSVQELLLNALLGIAGDVAAGPWDLKVQNTQKWLTKAQLLMEEIFKTQEVQRPKEAHRLRYETLFRSLTILCSLQGEITDCLNEFLTENLTVLKQAESSQEYVEICMNSSLILDDASQICVSRNETAIAQKCLNRAIAMMVQIEKNKKELNINETFLFSQLYYHKGMIFSRMASQESPQETMASEEQNRKSKALHREAVVWYDKSIPYLTEVIKKKEWKDLLQLGTIVNGMSVSYTETGNTKKAYVLLKTAIFCIEQHVESHPNDKKQLMTPYQNMLQLLEFLGKTEEMNEIRQKMKGVSF